jgi:hypothetical protein
MIKARNIWDDQMPTCITQFDDAAPDRNFDRYLAIDFRINGTINLTHSALADLSADFITGEFSAG